MEMRLKPEQEELVLQNRGLSRHIAKKFNADYSIYEDLVQIGNIGLIKAAITYDSTKNVKFASYASICIQNEILMYFRKGNGYSSILHLDDPINLKDRENLVIADTIYDPRSNYFIENMEANDFFKEAISIILNNLQKKEMLTILYRIAGNKQREVAKKLGLSQSYVSRLEKRARCEIQQILEQNENEKNVYNMDIIQKHYKIEISLKKLKGFNGTIEPLLKTIVLTANIYDIKVIYQKECIAIITPSDLRWFEPIAKVIQEIDNFYEKNKY